MKKCKVLATFNYKHCLKKKKRERKRRKKKAAFKAASFQKCGMCTTANSTVNCGGSFKGKTRISVNCFYRIPNVGFPIKLNEKGKRYGKSISLLQSSDYFTNTG